jgi:uncharacterized protein (TIGR01589 family)
MDKKKRKSGGSSSSSSGKKRQRAQKVSWEDIKFVQNLIERCLLQYMTQAEIITALQAQANIDPAFTCLVWEKLLDQNRDFFYLYGIKLRMKDQIVAFNYLVDQHVQLLKSVGGGANNSTGMFNGEGITKQAASLSKALEIETNIDSGTIGSNSSKNNTSTTKLPSPTTADTDKFFA